MFVARASLVHSLVLSGLLAACGGDSSKDGADAGADADTSEDDATGDVPCPDTIAPFEPGLSATGAAGIKAVLVSADPETPHKYENSWVLDFVDAQGKPIDDIKVDSAKTFMPVHGHGGGLTPVPMNLAEPGRVQIDVLNFTMPGPWQVTIESSSSSAGKDRIVFNVCVGR